MIFDFNIPWLEFRVRLQLICKTLFSDSMFKIIEFDVKIPWISFDLLFHFINPIVYRHCKFIEFATMRREGCWKLVLFNKIYRNYYDNYPVIEDENGK